MNKLLGKSARKPRSVGMAELSLVEHALCPLDSRISLQDNLVHFSEYFYSDRSRHKRKAQIQVNAPIGLSAADEFYLWGLLALTCSQPEPTADFYATPHFCLRRLGSIDQHARRGGRQYQRFADAMDRLASVTYRNDAFYDPIRGEHRKVRFGFFSYSLPHAPQSCRAWRIAWDPLFFEYATAGSRRFRFDLGMYRQLDCASRRLFLLLQKMFSTRLTETRFELRHLAVGVLGFSATLPLKKLRQKTARTVESLVQANVLQPSTDFVSGARGGPYTVHLQRGPYFDQRSLPSGAGALQESPLYDPLHAIGLDDKAIRRIVHQYEPRLIQEWADITLAALDRKGRSFFRRSPQAFFVDNLKQAAQGSRTPPDWWHELRRAEQQNRKRRESTAPAPIAEIVTELLSSITDDS